VIIHLAAVIPPVIPQPELARRNVDATVALLRRAVMHASAAFCQP
jgi:hypothetical protein